MNNDQMSRLKIEILKIAKEMLVKDPHLTHLYSLQDFLGQIDANEDGINFNDGESYTIDQIIKLIFQESYEVC